jgi:pyruvate/2-oxoglutarate dehydrogenase complex dihydrolipoamide acyltransferase (E2) component
MPIEILMPALSPTMTEGNLARWVKKEGDAVHSGDVLAEIETDKAMMEVEAVDDGRVGKILVPEGAQGVHTNNLRCISRQACSHRRARRSRAATGPGSFGNCGDARDQPAQRQWPDFRQPLGPPHGATGRS